MHSILSEEEPGLKLAADILGCCCVALTCWAFCAFCHIDPLGKPSLATCSSAKACPCLGSPREPTPSTLSPAHRHPPPPPPPFHHL